MDTIGELCVGIVIWGVIIGLLVGYTLMCIGIGEQLGPALGIFAFITIFSVIFLAPLGAPYNHKIQLGGQIFLGSIAVALVIVGFIVLLGNLLGNS